MDIRVVSLGGTPLLEAEGDIDHATCGDLEGALHKTLDAGASVVLIDLTAVHYIDSGGLSVIFSALRRIGQGGWLGIIGPNSNIMRLLELVGLKADPRLRVFADRQAVDATKAGTGEAG